jgi:alcohol dehydrogenase class IV
MSARPDLANTASLKKSAAAAMKGFTSTIGSSRVVFGSGTVTSLADEVARLRRSRVLLLGGRRIADAVDDAQSALGSLVVARFDDAAMHTPTDVTARALQIAEAHAVDCVVAVGGWHLLDYTFRLAPTPGNA